LSRSPTIDAKLLASSSRIKHCFARFKNGLSVALISYINKDWGHNPHDCLGAWLVKAFFRLCVRTLSRRGMLFVAMNALYFGFIVVGAFLEQARFLSPYELIGGEGFFLFEEGLPLMIIGIFLFNLVVSGFFFTTLSGLVFFPLPLGVLVLRALAWGALLNLSPTPQLFAALPSLVLEGEGYVLAALAGVNMGLSWLKPEWAISGGKGLSRWEAVKRALKDAGRIYVLVTVFLFVAAVAETATLVFI